MEDKGASAAPPHLPEKPPEAPPPPPCSGEKPDSISGFFRKLLPSNLDIADLLIVLLILLMAGDREENRNDALLTLALYFFM